MRGIVWGIENLSFSENNLQRFWGNKNEKDQN
jgi:hypothetical protein